MNKMCMKLGVEYMKPIVGVIPLWDDEKDSIWMLPGYMEGIREAGAIPIILPLTENEILYRTKKQKLILYEKSVFQYNVFKVERRNIHNNDNDVNIMYIFYLLFYVNNVTLTKLRCQSNI